MCLFVFLHLCPCISRFSSGVRNIEPLVVVRCVAGWLVQMTIWCHIGQAFFFSVPSKIPFAFSA